MSIRTLSRPKDWTEPQRRMMRRAGRVHGLRVAGGGRPDRPAELGWDRGVWELPSFRPRRQSEDGQHLGGPWDHRETFGLSALGGYSGSDPCCRTREESSREKLNASLALLPVDPNQVEYLEKRLLDAALGEISVLRDALQSQRSILIPKLWSEVEGAKPGSSRLLPAAGALARYDSDNPQWADLAEKVAGALVTVNSVDLGSWLDVLRPVQAKLTAPLAAIFRDKGRPEAEQYPGDQ